MMWTVLAAIVVFTVTILVLVGLMLAARHVLIPAGSVRVLIEGGRAPDVRGQANDTLLSLLTQGGIYLPAGCGGQGTCGACRVRITQGAGPLLPTEAAHISRVQAQNGWRLACQTKVRRDLAVEIPQEIIGVRRWSGVIRSARNVATFIREITIDLAEGDDLDFQAGGYVQIECPTYRTRFADFDIADEFRSEWERYGLFDLEAVCDQPVSRAYSMANAPHELGVVMLNVRIATPPVGNPDAPPGVVSSYLFSLKPGDPVALTGPFGDFFARETDAEMVFVGGGAGMAPMRAHILDQLERRQTRRRMSFWYGARSLKEAFYVDLFSHLAAEHENFEWHLALSDPAPEDRWDGYVGFIHQVLYTSYLETHPAPEDV
ncbi:MAG: NADH:ubiquinone reductase (Na(+)-transporting) subunit F, partial [Gemmatimonadetes bacterium]|nr:NADH:ubiquinone reductase (Na(+)-transporting) subunit F [Gemmatimonadota bacterium]